MPTSSYVSAPTDSGGRVMVTNSGAHPPEFWAQVTAEHVAPISTNMTGERRLAAMALQGAVQRALVPIHADVAERERMRVAASGDGRAMLDPYDPNPNVANAVAAVQAAAKGTEWEDHFNDADVVAAMSQEICSHFATSQHIERSAYADRYPTSPGAAAFRAAHHPGA
jgi:hypothetical protein